MNNHKRQTFSEWLALTEAGKNAAVVKWIKKQNEWFGKFNINNIEYNIEAYTNNDIDVDFDIWEFKFFKDKIITKITGDFKTHFILVPTISKAFEDFVKEKKPDCVLFLASDESKSRKSLYKQNSDSIASKYNYYSVNPHIGEHDMLFGICKDKSMIQEIRNLMGI